VFLNRLVIDHEVNRFTCTAPDFAFAAVNVGAEAQPRCAFVISGMDRANVADNDFVLRHYRALLGSILSPRMLSQWALSTDERMAAPVAASTGSLVNATRNASFTHW
jgi:hypothetical protein